MCGIVGAISFEGSGFEITSSYIERMRDAMAHRGPDGAGTWISPDRTVGLGHRRLKIIDLSEQAAQPMSNLDGALWITFNGEIYNHAEIRKELQALGHREWKTDHSDTEVILRAYEQWGIECIQKFKGMFAFGLWDGRSRDLWLVRDRMGIKPLYYSCHHGRLVFASEIKALLEDPQQVREVEQEALIPYMAFMSVPAPMTLFKGIHKVPCSRIVNVRPNGSVSVRRYYNPLESREDAGRSEEETASLVLETLRDAVRIRKVSDVPVGVFLSGGIDSSTNAVLFSEGESGPVKTFTVAYDGHYSSYPNESKYAQAVADLVGAEHHEIVLGPDDVLDFLPRMIELQDEAIADPVCVPSYYVSKLARENGVIVAQVGEGADELFCGYHGWKSALKIAGWNEIPMTGALKRLLLVALDVCGRSRRPHRERLRRGIAGYPVFWTGAEAFGQTEREWLIGEAARPLRRRDAWEFIRPLWQEFQDSPAEKTHLNWMTYSDLNFRLPELLLMRVDKMSMGVSLEARVPFLDHRLVELAFSIPSATRIKEGNLKYILKKAVRGLIPDEIIDRRKQGFGVPLVEWFYGKVGEQAKKDLKAFSKRTGYFDGENACALIDQGEGKRAWYLWNFAKWHERFIES